MYLFRASSGPTFVSVSYNRNRISLKIKTYLLVILGLMTASQMLWSQNPEFMRPGDVNNDELVDGLDILFWAIASEGTPTGPERTFDGTAFEFPIPVRPGDLWEQTFANGLNFLFADCDGNGVIDSMDLEVINMNFGMTAPGVSIKEEETNEEIDPQIKLNSLEDVFIIDTDVEVDFDLSNGQVNRIDGFIGASFLFKYNPIDPRSQRMGVFRFEVLDNAWFAAGEGDDVNFRWRDDREKGEIEFFIWRKDGQPIPSPPDGGGNLGTLTIVIAEDLLGSLQAKLEIESIKLLDKVLEPVPAAGDILIRDIGPNRVVDRQTSARYVEAFPVPADEELTVRMKDPQLDMNFLEVYDLQGRLWKRVEVNANKAVLDAASLPSGMFMLKIFTDYGIFVRPANRR